MSEAKQCVMAEPEETQGGALTTLPSATRESILNVDDVQIICIDVPEWGCSVHIRTLTEGEQGRYHASNIKPDGTFDTSRLADHHQRYLVLALCDEDGARIFSDKDVGYLGKKNPKVIRRLFDIAQQHNETSIEELEGN